MRASSNSAFSKSIIPGLAAISAISAVSTTGCTRQWESGNSNSSQSQSSTSPLVTTSVDTPPMNGVAEPNLGPLRLIASSPSNGWTGVSTQTGLLFTFNQPLAPLLNGAEAFQRTSGVCDDRMPIQIRHFDPASARFICLGIPAEKVHLDGLSLEVAPLGVSSTGASNLSACTQFVIYINKTALQTLSDSRIIYFSTGSCVAPASPTVANSASPSPSASPTPVTTATAIATPGANSGTTPAQCSDTTTAPSRINELVRTGVSNPNVPRVVDTFPRDGQSQLYFGPRQGMRQSPIDTSQDVEFYVSFSDPLGTLNLPIQVNSRSIAEKPRSGDKDYFTDDSFDHSYSYEKYSPCDPKALIHLYKSTQPGKCVGVNPTGPFPFHVQWTNGKVMRFDVPYLEPFTSYTMEVRREGIREGAKLAQNSAITFITAPMDASSMQPLTLLPIAMPAYEDIVPSNTLSGIKMFSSSPQRAELLSGDLKEPMAYKNLLVMASFKSAFPANLGRIIQPTQGTCLPDFPVSLKEISTGICLAATDLNASNLARGAVPSERNFGVLSFRVPALNPSSEYSLSLFGSSVAFRTAPKSTCMGSSASNDKQ